MKIALTLNNSAFNLGFFTTLVQELRRYHQLA
jgi:hypothetical protein